jgi:uncharacterized protein (DUF1697 family)
LSVQIALLRGINVGSAKRVAMADLRSLVESLGYGNVSTLLNSGNVVLTSGHDPAKTASRIEKGLESRLGVASRVTVITAAELSAIVRGNPLLTIADNPSRLLVSVLSNPADRSILKPLAKQDWAPDALALGSRVVYLWCSAGLLDSPVAVAVGRALGAATTARNWATILKLHALAGKER